MLDITKLNPISGFKLGGLSTIGNILLLVTLAGLVVVMVGVLMWVMVSKKTFWIKIHVFRLIGNTPTRVANYKAKEENIGLAGDKLWRVAPTGISMPFKIIKWLPVGKYQAAPREFWYWIRQDGEWINFTFTDLDDTSKLMGIKFIQEDMRLQRLATERLLYDRFMKKSFWEKYGHIIMYLLFFLVITVAMVIIFYQWSKIIDKTGELISMVQSIIERQSAVSSLIPAK